MEASIFVPSESLNSARSKPLPKAWLVVGLLWVAVTINVMVRFLPTTIHASLVAAIPMTEAQFGLLTTMLFWMYGITSPFAGFLADRFDRTRMILGSLVLWSVLTWMSSYARTFGQLLALRALLGAVEGCYYPAALALICDYHRGATRSLAVGLHNTGFVVGVGLSGLGGWMAHGRSWHFAFTILGLVGLVYSVVLALLLRDAPRKQIDPVGATVRFGAAMSHLFSNRSFLLAFTVMCLLGVGDCILLAWIPVFVQEHFHLSEATAGFSGNGPMNAAAIPGMLFGGFWADRWSRRNRRGRMLVPALGFICCIPGLCLVTHATAVVVAISGFVLFRLFRSFFDANEMPILCEVVDPRYRATGFGLFKLISLFAGGAAIYLTGILRDHRVDLITVFGLIPIIYAATALILFFIKPRPEAGEAHA